jgi:hypothetical protein
MLGVASVGGVDDIGSYSAFGEAAGVGASELFVATTLLDLR